jgi:oxygen-independent coproporphyrinogen-3 oxidase
MEAVKPFLTSDAEVTAEGNPGVSERVDFSVLKNAGINRLSFGLQSSNERELSALGRIHSPKEAEETVKAAQKAGFDNISLDLMLGLPNSNTNTLKQSLDFLLSLKPEHISAYSLKIEPKTLFYKERENLNLPNEDAVCDQYLFMCDYLEDNGFSHYEISNFSRNNKMSKHNLKYWRCQEYLGLGPSAHSFLDGKRFYFERDLKAYINGATPTPDGDGGSEEEKLMLGLRLKDGVDYDALPKLKADLFINNGLAEKRDGKFFLTNKGFLISNAIIGELI